MSRKAYTSAAYGGRVTQMSPWSITFAPPTSFANEPGGIVNGARNRDAVQTRVRTRRTNAARLQVSRAQRSAIGRGYARGGKNLSEKGEDPPGHFAYLAGFLSKVDLHPELQK